MKVKNMENQQEIIKQVKREAKKLELSTQQIAEMIDHTLLNPYSKETEIEKICDEAIEYDFHSVAVNPYYTKTCVKKLKKHDQGVTVTIGFPLGQNTKKIKKAEAKQAKRLGADEIDMVMNIAAFKDGKKQEVKQEIKEISKSAKNLPLKVIIETGYLSNQEIKESIEMIKDTDADYVKNSTGFGPIGANIEHICLMKKAADEKLGIKAAGGIRSYGDVAIMVAAGADRIGSSSSVKIIETVKSGKKRIENSNTALPLREKIDKDKIPEELQKKYK